MYAKIFQSGNSQAVRLPEEFRFDTAEVEIYRRGDEVILRPKRENLKDAFMLLTQMPNDFMAEGRVDEPPQERDGF